ncbi:MAG TPA: hypothetical protein VG820_14025 [Fimbriimonadaceae bacterium]|nr:hypothetical protein [Fimbriimonadaceae bacterium]
MIKTTTSLAALAVVLAVPCIASASLTGSLAAVSTVNVARFLPSHPVINQILINPKNGGHNSSFIALKCAASQNLNGYAVVVIENENGGGGTDGRGTIDNIFPLDGFSADANGNFVIRDTSANGTTLGPLGNTSTHVGNDPFVGGGHEMLTDFATQYTISLPARGSFSAGTLTYGGNDLENGGGTFLVVQNLNPSATQQHTASGVKVNGTAVDSNPGTSKGRFDWQVSSGFQLCDSIYDAFYVGEGTDTTGFGTSLDYATNITLATGGTRAIFPLLASNWSYNFSGGSTTVNTWIHSPDYICRLWDSNSPTSNSCRTHTSHDFNGNAVTVDDVLACEVDTSSPDFQFFKQGNSTSNLEVLWDLTDVSGNWTSTKAYASPAFAFNFTAAGVTYYQP